MKNFLIFKGNIRNSDINRKSKFREILNLRDFDLQKHLPQKFPKRH